MEDFLANKDLSQSQPSQRSEAPPTDEGRKVVRNAFKMQLFKGFEKEYKKRHDEIWPELRALLKETGVADYSIFLDETNNSLFGVLTTDDPILLDNLPAHPVMQRWWKYMADIMETNPDHSPVQIFLKEVFYMP